MSDQNENHRQVNENQCQACMPLGSVIALKGIEGSMAVVHGSQGCSTYMRLSMVEHFNEPIDIASSSLNEKQAVYGGEQNLRKALDNVTRVYHPRIIGVMTTCLTETMGEDIDQMIQVYRKERKGTGIDIIPISTPSYSGSVTEGYWTATREIIRYYAKDALPHDGINVILPLVSPADIREIKRILDLMKISYTLIPDISSTLDRPYGIPYEKIPPGGTKPEDIQKMSGARATIQFGIQCPDSISPGLFLKEKFGVPLYNLSLPVSLHHMDQLIDTLCTLSGNPVPSSIMLERGWLCDAMADAHKYMAEVRPVLYGEPELISAIYTLCMENGSEPRVIATGSPHYSLLDDDVTNTEGGVNRIVLKDADFASIEYASVQRGGNLAIGHSGGKILTERHGIPLVRVGYPVHDRLGGQRIVSVGYTGTLTLLERIANAYIEEKYRTYRQNRKAEYYDTGGMMHAES